MHITFMPTKLFEQQACNIRKPLLFLLLNIVSRLFFCVFFVDWSFWSGLMTQAQLKSRSCDRSLPPLLLFADSRAWTSLDGRKSYQIQHKVSMSKQSHYLEQWKSYENLKRGVRMWFAVHGRRLYCLQPDVSASECWTAFWRNPKDFTMRKWLAVWMMGERSLWTATTNIVCVVRSWQYVSHRILLSPALQTTYHTLQDFRLYNQSVAVPFVNVSKFTSLMCKLKNYLKRVELHVIAKSNHIVTDGNQLLVLKMRYIYEET